MHSWHGSTPGPGHFRDKSVLNDERIDPPIQAEYLRTGGATTLIFIVDGASAAAPCYALADALEHRGATGQHNVRVKVRGYPRRTS